MYLHFELYVAWKGVCIITYSCVQCFQSDDDHFGIVCSVCLCSLWSLSMSLERILTPHRCVHKRRVHLPWIIRVQYVFSDPLNSCNMYPHFGTVVLGTSTSSGYTFHVKFRSEFQGNWNRVNTSVARAPGGWHEFVHFTKIQTEIWNASLIHLEDCTNILSCPGVKDSQEFLTFLFT